MLRNVRQVSRYHIESRSLVSSINTRRNISSPNKNVTLIEDSNCTRNPNENDMPISEMKNPFEREKKLCILCQHKIDVDYKNVKLLSQFVSPYTGKIYGRHITRLCTKQQKKVEEEIVKSQSAGFMAYYLKDVAFMQDPKIFDPEQPIRPHRF